MILALYRNPRELWNKVKDELAEKECLLVSPLERVESLASLQKLDFPVVVRTWVDYEAVGPMVTHRILTKEEVDKIKKEVMDMVISPYLDIIQKRGQ